MNAPAARDQLSLFASGADADRLDALRRTLDPVQAALIPAHVTLCREDELAGVGDWAALTARLHRAAPLTLRFGAPERFHGHGVLLPCLDGQADFDALRRRVLGRDDLRPSHAHLTLAHPRNPEAPGNRLPMDELGGGLVLTLTDLRWVRQSGGGAWQTLARHRLGTT